MGLFQGEAPKQIPLNDVTDAIFQQNFDHARIPETARFMHRVISEFVCRGHLLQQQFFVAREGELFIHEELDNLQLVVLDGHQERRFLIFLLRQKRRDPILHKDVMHDEGVVAGARPIQVAIGNERFCILF